MCARLRVFALALVFAGLLAGPAQAAFPGGNGRIVFQSNRGGNPLELYLMNEDATDVRRLTFNDAQDRMPRFSPDGRTVVFSSNRDGDFDLYLLDVESGTVTQLTNDAERDDNPAFTGDGAQVVWQRGPFFCPCAIWSMPVSGGQMQQLATGPGNAAFPDPSPQGQTLAFASDRDGTWRIYRMQLNGKGLHAVTEGAAPAFGDFRPRWSPTGRDLVFLRDDGTNQNDVYVVHQDGTGLAQLTSGSRLEEHANFSPDGTQIVFGVFEGGSARLHTIRHDGTGERTLRQLAAPFAEDFDDGVVDTSLWHVISDPGGTIGESGGQLVASIEAGAVPGGPWNQIDQHVGSQCDLRGDFDYEVDYRLLRWQPVGFYAALQAFWEGAGVMRAANPWGQQYIGWAGGSGNGIPTTDAAGALRVVRSGTSFSTYARAVGATEWTPVFTGPVGGVDTVFGLGLWAPGDQYAGDDASVAFDRFRVNAGQFACPSWWRDSGPDWQAVPRGKPEPPTAMTWDPFADFRLSPNQSNPSADAYGYLGTWSYLYSDGLVHDPSRYSLLSHHTVVDQNREQWDLPGWINLLVAHVKSESRLLFHSFGGAAGGYGRSAILAWKSPVTGTVRIAGSVALPPLAQCGSGSGIVWSIDKGASTLESLVLPAGDSAAFDLSTAVAAGETVYFVHDPGFDSNCDSAFVELRISTS